MRSTAIACLGLAPALAGPAAAATAVLTPVRDNTLCEDAGGQFSNGAGDYFHVGRVGATGGTEIRRGVLAFDVAATVPAGATITSAVLTLEMSKANPLTPVTPIALHRLTADWGEGTSTAGGGEGRCAASTPGASSWIHRMAPAATWAAPGGDFDPVPAATVPVGTPRSYTWGSSAAMVADVQLWLDDPAMSFGWILIGDETRGQTAKRFNSRDNPDPLTRPELTVEYTTGGANPILYEHTDPDPCQIISAGTAITTTSNPFPFNPAGANLLYYQVDGDASCATPGPPLLHLVKEQPLPGSGRVVASF